MSEEIGVAGGRAEVRKSEASIKVAAEPLLISWPERDLNWRDSNLPPADKHGWRRTRIGSAIGGVNFSFFPQSSLSDKRAPSTSPARWRSSSSCLRGRLNSGSDQILMTCCTFGSDSTTPSLFPSGWVSTIAGRSDGLFLVTSSRIGEWPKTRCEEGSTARG